MFLLPIPAIMRERVALSTMSGICRYKAESEEFRRKPISREVSDVLKHNQGLGEAPKTEKSIDTGYLWRMGKLTPRAAGLFLPRFLASGTATHPRSASGITP